MPAMYEVTCQNLKTGLVTTEQWFDIVDNLRAVGYRFTRNMEAIHPTLQGKIRVVAIKPRNPQVK